MELSFNSYFYKIDPSLEFKIASHVPYEATESEITIALVVLGIYFTRFIEVKSGENYLCQSIVPDVLY